MHLSGLVYDVAYLAKRMGIPKEEIEDRMRKGSVPGAFNYSGKWFVCKCMFEAFVLKCIFEAWHKDDPPPVSLF